MLRRLRLHHVAALAVAAGGIAGGLTILVFSALVDDVLQAMGELARLHADTRARVFALETVKEARDVVAAGDETDQGGLP